MEDQIIIDLLFARDEQALTELKNRFGTRLYRTAYNVLGSREDAEEAVNDTYLALWNAIPPARPEPLEGYVHRTGRNIALKMLRFQSAQKRNSQWVLSLDELSGAIPGENTSDVRALGQAIDRFLDTLPRTSRILFVRRYWFGDSVTQLAKELTMSENSISVRLNRIRNRLKTYLIKEGFSP